MSRRAFRPASGAPPVTGAPTGRVPRGVRVPGGALPRGTAALAVADGDGAAITVSTALSARGRGYALRAALHALAAPRSAGVSFAGVVAVRPEWAAAGRA